MPSKLHGVVVTVHYELLDAVPAMLKWVTVSALRTDPVASSVLVGNVVVETLRVNEDYAGGSYPIASPWLLGGGGSSSQPPLLFVSTDTAHGTTCSW
jgi:hypothetical protein